MAMKPGERRLQILQTLATMLEHPRCEKVTTAALRAGRQRMAWRRQCRRRGADFLRHRPLAAFCQDGIQARAAGKLGSPKKISVRIDMDPHARRYRGFAAPKGGAPAPWPCGAN